MTDTWDKEQKKRGFLENRNLPSAGTPTPRPVPGIISALARHAGIGSGDSPGFDWHSPPILLVACHIGLLVPTAVLVVGQFEAAIGHGQGTAFLLVHRY